LLLAELIKRSIMARGVVWVGLIAGAVMALAGCGAGVDEDAPAQTTQVAPPNPAAPDPSAGETNAEARAEKLGNGGPDGATPPPDATAGATAEEMAAPASPAEAAAAAGGATGTTAEPSR
jgi:hypothetical protein